MSSKQIINFSDFSSILFETSKSHRHYEIKHHGIYHFLFDNTTVRNAEQIKQSIYEYITKCKCEKEKKEIREYSNILRHSTIYIYILTCFLTWVFHLDCEKNYLSDCCCCFFFISLLTIFLLLRVSENVSFASRTLWYYF